MTIGSKPLRLWLADPKVRERFEAGDVSSRQSCAADLEAMATIGHGGPEAPGEFLVGLVLDESLRRLAGGDATVETVRRTEQAVLASEQRIVLTSRGNEDAYANAVDKLHPWRRDEAESLVDEWPQLRHLVITLVSQKDRSTLLGQWAANLPLHLDDAPAEVWCWLASVASDYGATETALFFIEGAIHRGASSSYWWARAGLLANKGDTAAAERARELWRRSQPPHPLALAALAIDSHQYAEAERALEEWSPETPNDASIRAILQSAAATGVGDFNRGIAIGLRASQTYPEASGNALRTAEALLSRGHHGVSDHAMEDFTRSYELAIQARDSRRRWLGDSVAAILVAVKASAMSSDISRAWQLTQPPPEGAALPEESQDPRLRQEAAILAASLGHFELARRIASELRNEFVMRTVEGWEAYHDDDHSAAEAAWLAAWDLAPSDVARVQTAMALAPLGASLPDLSLIPDEYSETAKQIREIHSVLSTPGDRLTLLRARASQSVQLTVLLAEHLLSDGDHAGAAAVLKAGGTRWKHPVLMRMAADRYLSAGDYPKAERAALTAMSLGGPHWAGRLEALTIQFEALESQGRFEDSLAVAREMVAIAPENLGVRWALVHCLARSGDTAAAWNALSHDGQLVRPRNATEARTWVGLSAAHDDSPQFVQRCLETMANWADDPHLVGVYLAQIYGGLMRHDRSVAEADLRELHKATAQYMEDHPDSPTFRGLTVDEDDPLGSLADELRRQAESPRLRELRTRVEEGTLPLGLLSDVLHRPYAEACIRRAAGSVYSHAPQLSESAGVSVTAALGGSIVVDTSAAVTLALLGPELADQAWGSFLTVETTDIVFRDALDAHRALGLRSTMSLGWNTDEDRPYVDQISDETADMLARHAHRTVELLTKSARKGWPGLAHFAAYEGEGTWLSALDYAIAHEMPFWCDDRMMRQLATQNGVATFGTVDLLHVLEETGALGADLAAVARATLVHNFHVDLEFNAQEMRLAATFAAWHPLGAAAALTRVHAWADPAAVVSFVGEAIDHVVAASPTAVQGWVWAASTGLIRIAADDKVGASDNLRLLLTYFMSQHWLRPDTLRFVVQGIREARGTDTSITDPLRSVLDAMYRSLAGEHGAPAAAEFTLMLVALLDPEDRATAANVILTSHSWTGEAARPTMRRLAPGAPRGAV